MATHPEIGMLILLWGTALLAAAWAYRRQQDPFDPGVFIPIAYVYLTTGPILFKITTGTEYHPGLKIQMLQPVMLSAITAVIGYAIGTSIALRSSVQTALSQAMGSVSTNVQALGNRWATSLLRGMSLLGCVVALSAFAWATFRIQYETEMVGADKAEVLAAADDALVAQLQLSAAATSLLLTFFVITDAYVSKTAFSWPVLLLLGADFVVCAAAGERDFMLVAIIWFTVNWKRLPGALALAALAFFVFWMGMSAVIRNSGLGLFSQLRAITDVSFEDWFRCVTCISGNLLVYTNVSYEVPVTEDHWLGRSLAGTLLSFVPGHYPLAEETPARWFMKVYDWQKVAGHAFAQDAEAYLNFGWMGPPIWFAIWGWVMGVIYRRATRVGAHLSDVFIWWHATGVSLFAIRSDSRTPAKMLIYGIIASKLVCYVADLWGASQARTGSGFRAGAAPRNQALRPPRRPLPPPPRPKLDHSKKAA